MQENTEREGVQPQAGPEAAEIKVMSCIGCQGPVPSNVEKCYTCGAPLTGKEFPYVATQPAGPDITGMVKWWAILSVIILALGGFSFGVWSTLGFSVVTLVYGVRILRAYFL